MSGHNDLISNIGKKTVFCNNLGFGEQGAILAKMPKSLFVCSNVDNARKMKEQLDALNKENVLIDDFNKMFTLSKFESSEHRLDLIKTIEALCFGNPIIISTPQILFTQVFDLDEFKSNAISLEKSKDYDLIEIEKHLVQIGYKKVDSVTTPGEFSRRGDILDIFNITSLNPTRFDFFDTNLETITNFDSLTFEKIETLKEATIIPNKQIFLSETKREEIVSQLNSHKVDDDSFHTLCSSLELGEDVPLEFIEPFSTKVKSFAELDIPIIISENIKFHNIYESIQKTIEEKINSYFKNEKLKNIYKNSKKYLKIADFYNNFNKKLMFFDNFNINSTELKNNFDDILNVDFNTINLPSFLYNLENLKTETAKFKDKQIYLCLSSQSTIDSIKKIFTETNTPFSTNKNDKGLILTDLTIPYNICFESEEKWYIGSTNFAHKKEFKQESKKTIKYLPKAGEYVVHSTHGIGKCEGIVTVSVSGVDKEFFKLIYRGGDVLYVPYENADCLSLYMTESAMVNLNKLGGKEFGAQKLKAQKSIEDMSGELLELYAKRKTAKGFKYPEDDYLFTEFENSFEFKETADQLQAIQDIKNDMHAGKVMDRLVCGDVGFGKTEVAMRALFKAVLAGKQVAVLAPTTILSLQHCETVRKRTKEFGINVEMLNRFKTTKEQKQILSDLEEGKIQVICGTHRLLSKDVKFKDLGLLILDEEQRFGVKAKEQIKQLKNNVNVLTLSATPIPRTLSMSLMNIRDISIINTPPVDRLPVKTYVMCYNEDVVVNAINDEINRGGQVLVVYNNVENLPALANKLKLKVTPKAVFDIAHGQMSEIALENAVKRLYDKETNVFVSTTLIENGVDLPKANTLIVIDSDRLGLSQMYQLRGRVGRSTEQAYAYFTYHKEKLLTEESTNRLQAIAENTDLGSGFKIALRDLQIRGAGELLGKTQHGHMLKIGYELYSKLLNDTLRKLKGEKVEIERDVKIDVALTSKIPSNFVEEESERLKIIAKISNITSKDSARSILNELLAQFGKLPREIYNLTNIALLKALAIKNKVKQIVINKQRIAITYYDDIDINALMKKVQRFNHFKFENGSLPTITLNPSFFSPQTALNYITEYFNN